ncbi:hypothetical protein K435DRAFT_851137 [Dendrothele bispora CBS 962.96]|uniref:Uncharacterized protein n=1 Tax=Dendrothele bispora (strain CBS 962.96) TaxID=1314807 RepID=A0A4S8MMY4_DENBC|nr:hypothetical protein K435DRAFT_851137 [Dendrothele bispora CBS 962.96]
MTMEPENRDHIPSTTNAEESMHSKIYLIAGTGHDLIEGFDGLLKVEAHHHGLHDHATVGGSITYGKSGHQIRQELVEKTGTTKPSRKYSGRTSQDLEIEIQESSDDVAQVSRQKKNADMEQTRKHYAQISPTKSQLSDSRQIKKAPLNEYPSYAWEPTTCWLDSSLEAYYHTLLHYNHWDEFASFAELSSKNDRESGIHFLFCCLDAWKKWSVDRISRAGDQISANSHLSNIRNLFHDKLFALEVVKGSSQQSTFTIVSLLPLAHQTYGGSFKEWFQNMVDIKTRQLGEHVEDHCWRWRSENFYCHGPSTTASYISDIPVVLSVESIQDVDADQGMGNTDTPWDFPRSLYPLTRKLGQDHGLVYEMTARIFTSGHGRHFICRSVIPINGRAVVFDYDGMKHDGYSQRQAAKVDTLLAGHSPPCPSGYYTHAVIYHLKGGVKAQKVFHDHQVSEARKYFDIVPGNTSDDISRLSKSGFVELPDEAVAMWKDRPGREYELVEDDLENGKKKFVFSHLQTF